MYTFIYGKCELDKKVCTILKSVVAKKRQQFIFVGMLRLL